VHIEFLLEEASAEIVLNEIVPKIVGKDVTFSPRNFSGKQNLLKKLPDRLKGYKTRLKYEQDLKIVVLIDEDREDCTKLKQRLENIAKDAGLLTRSISDNFQILNRIAVEELEAWFFGDVEAIRKAYPRVPESLSQNRNYRKPDEIKGGTCEALERVLSSKGYFTKGYMPKTEVARNIAPHLHPENNISKSFQVFKDGLKLLIGLAK
jgi:Domain of unknown function (DUF4276)